MKKPWWMVVLLLACELCVVLLLIPGEYTERIIQRENELVERELGIDTRIWMNNNANKWYQSTMIDSGIYEEFRFILIPSEEERLNSKGMESMGKGWFIWVESRLEAFSNMIYQLFNRVAILLVWAPYMAILLVPAIFDGVATWRIKRSNFDYASPVIHRYSLVSLGYLIMGMLVAFFAPIALSPTIIPFVLMICCVLIGLTISNFQKRV